MKRLINITIISDSNPFDDLTIDQQGNAYKFAQLMGAEISTGVDKPLQVVHKLENPTSEEILEYEQKMELWLSDIIAKAKNFSINICPFNKGTINNAN